MQGYKPDAQVNLVCDEDHHFEDEELSREKMLKCSEEGDWNGLGDSDTETPVEWDCGIRCVREYSSALGGGGGGGVLILNMGYAICIICITKSM